MYVIKQEGYRGSCKIQALFPALPVAEAAGKSYYKKGLPDFFKTVSLFLGKNFELILL